MLMKHCRVRAGILRGVLCLFKGEQWHARLLKFDSINSAWLRLPPFGFSPVRSHSAAVLFHGGLCNYTTKEEVHAEICLVENRLKSTPGFFFSASQGRDGTGRTRNDTPQSSTEALFHAEVLQ